jgi:hypothetical protein
VALLVLLLEDMIGDGVVPVGVLDLCVIVLFCVDGEYRDLERLDGIGILGGRPGGGAGGGCPGPVDIGVTLLVDVDAASVLCVIVASSSSIGTGRTAGCPGGLIGGNGFPAKCGTSGAKRRTTWSSSTEKNLTQQTSNQRSIPNSSFRFTFALAEQLMLLYSSGLLYGHHTKMLWSQSSIPFVCETPLPIFPAIQRVI